VRLKQSLKAAGARTLGRLTARPGSPRVVVLCFHSVHPAKSFASATPELFERQLAWLSEHCDLVPLADALERAREGPSARVAVAVTFDDGYEDNYVHAFPLLVRYGVPATIFVTVGAVEGDEAVLTRLEQLRGATRDEVATLGWSQIDEMRAAGISFGSHTYSHPNLARLADDAVRSELATSKAIMEERLQAPVDEFAYPFGKRGRHFTEATVAAVRDAGYGRAAAVLFRRVRPGDSPFALPRFFVTRDEVPRLEEKILGSWDLLGLWQEHAPRPLARLVSPTDFRME
jgi:peptidoglycan/xylan/chitin deacetylase (PgdA/CDA1 family)